MKNKLSVLIYFVCLFILLLAVATLVKDDVENLKESLLVIAYQAFFLSMILIIGYLKFKKKIKEY